MRAVGFETTGGGAAGEDRRLAGAVVLGAARSGTSAITRMLVCAGFFAGRNDELLGPLPSNPYGHYELASALAVNEEILARSGSKAWSDAPAPEEQAWYRGKVLPRLEGIVESLIESGEGAPVVLKEPRLNGLLPVWEPVIERFLHPLLAVRDPLEIALSLAERDGVSIGHGLAAWELQMTSALHWLDGRLVTVAPYARLVSEPQFAVGLTRAVAAHLEPRRAGHVDPAAATAVFKADLHRQHGSGLAHDEYLTGRQAGLWAYLEALPPGDSRLALPAELRGASRAAREIVREESKRTERVEAQGEMLEAVETLEALAAKLEQQFSEAIGLAQQAAALSAPRAENDWRAQQRAWLRARGFR